MTALEEYNTLICYRKRNPPSGSLLHVHHIIPKCIGGAKNKSWNLVLLTVPEHYKAHCLLAKIYKDRPEYGKLLYAWHGSRYGNGMNKLPVDQVEFDELMIDFSKVLRAKRLTDAQKRRIGLASKGRHHTEETKRKISAAHKGRPSPNKGKKLGPMSEERKAKISRSLKGKPFTEEHKQRISEGNRGRKVSEETRRKMSESHKKLYAKEHNINEN